MLTTVDVKIPIPRISWRTVSGKDVFMLLCALALAGVVLSGIWWGIDAVNHRPKVVTKTVTSYATPLDQKTDRFMKDCEASENDHNDHGIPIFDTQGNWRCQYADN